MPGATRSRTISILAASLLLGILSLPAQAQIRLDLPAQSLGTSLTAVGSLGHLNVMFDPSVVDGLQAHALKAELSADDALDRLLSGTKLHAVRVDANTVRVIAQPAPKPVQHSGAPDTGATYAPAGAVHLAAADDYLSADSTIDKSEPPSMPIFDQSKTSTGKKEPILEEVIVTGTHIAGAPLASAITILDRAYIESSGYSTVEGLLATIPQNFSGGATRDSQLGQSNTDAGFNYSNGSTLNLRGLGSNSTLVLLNGRRLPSSAAAEAVDVSLIPLSAIERVEIVNDAATAAYGSDAIGGVVNFITRSDYNGAEIEGHYGSVTRGDLSERGANALLGRTFESGHAVLSFDTLDQTPLDARDRSFASQLNQPWTLISGQKRLSSLLTGSIQLSSVIQLFGDGSYSEAKRTAAYNLTGPYDSHIEVKQGGVSAGAKIALSDRWRADVTLDYGLNNTSKHIGSIPSSANDFSSTYDHNMWSAEFNAEGTLLTTAAGETKLALGVSYRREAYRINDPLTTSASPSRGVAGAYGEVVIPIFGDEISRAGLELLQLSVAGRYDHYSDFGSSTNPKIGIVWSPVRGVKLRGTFSTAYRAPTFTELYGQPDYAYLLQLPDPSVPAGQSLTLVNYSGSNPALKPETAHIWTTGFDCTPDYLSGLTLGATYFDIKYKNRVVIPAVNPFDILANPSIYSSIIKRTPTLAEVGYLTSLPANAQFFNYYGPFSPGDIQVLLEDGFNNLSQTAEQGLDTSVAYTHRAVLGTFNLSVGGTYLFKLQSRISPTASAIDVVGTINYPVRFRVKSQLGWTVGAVSTQVFLNYTDHYKNDTVTPNTAIPSWTTVDAQLRYKFDEAGRRGTFLKGIETAISVENLFDRAPPYIPRSSNFIAPLGYDPTNANPLGRLISINLKKTF